MWRGLCTDEEAEWRAGAAPSQRRHRATCNACKSSVQHMTCRGGQTLVLLTLEDKLAAQHEGNGAPARGDRHISQHSLGVGRGRGCGGWDGEAACTAWPCQPARRATARAALCRSRVVSESSVLPVMLQASSQRIPHSAARLAAVHPPRHTPCASLLPARSTMPHHHQPGRPQGWGRARAAGPSTQTQTGGGSRRS